MNSTKLIRRAFRLSGLIGLLVAAVTSQRDPNLRELLSRPAPALRVGERKS